MVAAPFYAQSYWSQQIEEYAKVLSSSSISSIFPFSLFIFFFIALLTSNETAAQSTYFSLTQLNTTDKMWCRLNDSLTIEFQISSALETGEVIEKILCSSARLSFQNPKFRVTWEEVADGSIRGNGSRTEIKVKPGRAFTHLNEY